MTRPATIPSHTADVVVVGAGAGGLSTAVTAAHQGLRVMVLERADVCGGVGTSRYFPQSRQSWYRPLSSSVHRVRQR